MQAGCCCLASFLTFPEENRTAFMMVAHTGNCQNIKGVVDQGFGPESSNSFILCFILHSFCFLAIKFTNLFFHTLPMTLSFGHTQLQGMLGSIVCFHLLRKKEWLLQAINHFCHTSELEATLLLHMGDGSAGSASNGSNEISFSGGMGKVKWERSLLNTLKLSFCLGEIIS